MNRFKTIGDLFEEKPVQWSLRGDPHLWQAMQAQLAATPLPPTENELLGQLEAAFLSLSGKPLSTGTPFFVPAFAHGGLSSGYIAPDFWRDVAIPLLRRRYRSISSHSK